MAFVAVRQQRVLPPPPSTQALPPQETQTQAQTQKLLSLLNSHYRRVEA
jgi:hypothetical protein